MFTSKLVLRLGLLHRVTGGSSLKSTLHQALPGCCSVLKQKKYSTAADNAPPLRWMQLEPELEETLIPRKMSVSPLESWLSLRYSMPPALEPALIEEETEFLDEKVLPPGSVPVLEDDSGSSTPLSCKNVLKIRRRKMNRHKYQKLRKRRKFINRRIMHIRSKKKQKQFEKELQGIWRRAGLRRPSAGFNIPHIYLRHQAKKKG